MPNIYRVTIRKSWNGRNPHNSWVNTYVVSTDLDLNDNGWDAVVDKLSQFEAGFSLAPVNFLGGTISTWAQEPNYRYENLRSFTLNKVGSYAPLDIVGNGLPADVTGAADLNFALQLNKNARLGRKGKLFLRGCLTIVDIATDSYGKPSLTTGALQRFSNMLNLRNSSLQEIPEGFTLVMAPEPKRSAEGAGDGTTNPGENETLELRVWNAVGIGGVVSLPRDHKYFDRLTAREKAAFAALAALEAGPQQPIEGEIVEP